MATHRFTTEFIENAISVCVIDTTGYFLPYLQEFLVDKELEVIVISPEEVVTQEAQAQLELAYKIMVCTSPFSYSNQTEIVLENLHLFQAKTTIIMPVISGCELQVWGEIPYLEQFIQSQQNLITYCNDVLPQASFIFGQDVLLNPGQGSLLDLFCQHIQTGFVFAPSVSVSVHTLPAFCQKAVEEVLQPFRVSSAIAGRTKSASKLVQRVAQIYENYYFSDIAVQPVEAQDTQTFPFSVKIATIIENEDALVSWYTRQLPSPEMPTFFSVEKLNFFGFSADELQPQFTELAEPSYVYQEETTQVTVETEFVPQEEQEPAKAPETVISQPVESMPTQEKSASSSTPEQSKPSVTDFNVSSEIQRIFAHTRQEKKIERAQILVKAQSRIQKKSKKRTTLFYGGLAFTGLGLGVLLLMAVFLTSFHFLKKSLVTVMAKAAASEEVTEADWQRLGRSTKLVAAQASSYKTVVSLPQIEEAEHAVAASNQLQALSQSIANKNESLSKLVLTILGSETGNIDQLAENVGKESLTTYEKLASIEEEMSQVSFSENGLLEEASTRFQEQLDKLQKESILQQQLKEIISPLFGNSGRRTYAVIFQNNQELRPTGGFIEAVALLTFENGTLINHDLYSSYELHKKLPGDVAAPAEITRATGEKVFFFHDSNWDPDFPKSAERIQWFIEKSLNTSVGGVVAVDLYGLQNILEATGPLDLPEYNEVITHKNLFERMEFHSEVVLVESAKNQDYRKLLFSRVIERVLSLKEDKVALFLKSLEKSFIDRSAMIALKDTDEKTIFQGLGWVGAQVVPRCPSELTSSGCLVDPFMQVEANVGANKANYYLKRTIDHSISISPTEAKHTRVISFENIAQLDAWPKGAYKNYMRFYLPSAAVSPTIKIDGIAVPNSEITKIQENGQQVLGFLLEVPIKSTKQVTMQYTVPFSFPQGSDFSYVFFNQEQPGNGDTPTLIRIVPSAALSPKIIAPQASLAADGIVFTREDDETGIYGAQFVQAK